MDFPFSGFLDRIHANHELNVLPSPRNYWMEGSAEAKYF